MPRPLLAIPLARAQQDLALLARMANRHGLVAGATGTGKTVTLRVLAEGFSRLGVPVFMADVKGDLSGLARPGDGAGPVAERVQQLGLADFRYEACPVAFWDVFGKQGHPVRATVSDLGPLLLARILGLNEIQEGVLQLAFSVADDAGLLLLDLKDLRAMVQDVSDRAAELRARYGNVSTASVGAIQRALLGLEAQGGEKLLGEPRVYATVLLWMLSELFERLPEVGDPEKPRLVFFFDEAHLLFDDAPRALLERIEQVVRLVRSKGVGVYFVTQNPLDLPDTVLGQLGNRVQHALRAFTPRDQKAVRVAADTFRARPGLDAAEVITQLGVGEALVSLLQEDGTPAPVERALVLPPASRLAPLTPAERAEVVRGSPLFGHYEQVAERESAYEKLRGRAEVAQQSRPAPRGRGGWSAPRGAGESALDMAASVAKSAARAAGTQLGREIMRGVLGSLFGGGGRRR